MSFYIIKPEAIQFSAEIQKLIISKHLKLINSAKILLPTTFIEKLYLGCSIEIIEATKYFLCNEVCEIGIVNGFNALEKLVLISGTETDPNKCNIGTIRNLFGVKEVQYFMGLKYYKNAIHRPKTNLELGKGIKLVEGLLD